jgi:predicted nucleic acid-binding protein
MLVCLDNHILVWGIRQEATPGQEDMIRRTKLFLDYLDRKNAQIIIPSVVAGEFLIKVPLEKQQKVMEVLEKNFQIAPYDTAAALIAAELWIEKNKGDIGISEDLKAGLQDTSRIKLKDDCKIVATAIKCKADCLYSEDDGVKKFAQGRIEVKEVPRNLQEQRSLFDESGDKRLLRKIDI